MKKSKILYLLTIIISLFSFNITAKAAQELTCTYNWDEHNNFKLILAQTKEGEQKLYLNPENVTIEDNGWRDALESGYEIYFENLKEFDTASIKNNNELTKCPDYYSVNNKKVYLHSKNEPFQNNMTTGQTSSDKFSEPILYSVVTEKEITENKKCDSISNLQIRDYDENEYLASCVYAKDTDYGCHIIQMDIKENGDFWIGQLEPININNVGIKTDMQKIDIGTIKDEYNGWCPNDIWVKRELAYEIDYSAGIPITTTTVTRVINHVKLETDSGYSSYEKVRGRGKNLVDTSLEQTDDFVDEATNIIGAKIELLTCEQIFSGEEGEKLIQVLHLLVNLVKIAIPILMIGLGIMDFAKAIFSGNEDGMKKAQSKFIKRIIIGVCIFLIPSLLQLILSIASEIWPNISADFCGIL